MEGYLSSGPLARHCEATHVPPDGKRYGVPMGLCGGTSIEVGCQAMQVQKERVRTPEVLRPVRYVRGVGPKLAESLAKSNIYKVIDLITWLPTYYWDPQQVQPIQRAAREGEGPVALVGKVLDAGEAYYQYDGKVQLELHLGSEDRPYIKVMVSPDDAAAMEAQLHIGDWVLVGGEMKKMQVSGAVINIIGPKRPTWPLPRSLCSLYPWITGMRPHRARSTIQSAARQYSVSLNHLIDLSEWNRLGLLLPEKALMQLHLAWDATDTTELNLRQNLAQRTIHHLREQIQARVS